MTNSMTTANTTKSEALEKVLVQGDLSKLSPEQRLTYYQRVCESLNLNPLTQPFEYINLNGKLRLYAKRDCTDQLRRRDKINIQIVSREVIDGVYVVTARASTPDGRVDESVGAVAVEGLKGEARANAVMKAETKAKRRVTLSICGLGVLDETEVEAIPAATPTQTPTPTPIPIPAPAPDPAPAPAATQEPEPESEPTPEPTPVAPSVITKKQLRHIHALCGDLGLSREERLAITREVVGRPVSSALELSQEEASDLIERLSIMLSERESTALPA